MKSSCLCRLFLLASLLTLLPSCGAAYRNAWQNAPQPQGVAGRWEGTWHSDATGHHGRLRCVVSEPVNKAGDHEFFYRATWKGILSGSYKATHNVRRKGQIYAFDGEHKMPDWAGGLYHYKGTINGDEFKAAYKSSADHGTYTMKRMR